MRVYVALTAAVACAAPLCAQGREPTRIDSNAVAAFGNGFFPREMDRRQIPGVVFVFVSGSAIAVARGYGAAQLEPRRSVDPERTVFRLASVSRAITVTAALQLVERGRFDLHQGVNADLRSFQVPAAHGPITLHHVLTHTAGFDERLTCLGPRRRGPHVRDLLPLGVSWHIEGGVPEFLYGVPVLASGLLITRQSRPC